MLSISLIFVILIGKRVEITFAQERKTVNSMQGFHMTVAAYQEPPIFMIVKDPANTGNITYTGFDKDTFDLLSHGLNFTYSFLEVTPDMVKAKGSVNDALLDQLLLKKADIHGRLLLPKAELLKDISYTIPLSVMRFVLLQPMPKTENRFLGPILPFQSSVWWWIIASFLATVIILTVTWKAEEKTGHDVVQNRYQRDTQAYVLKSLRYALEVLMSQGGLILSSRLSLRLMAGTWCLMAIIIVNAYNSMLFTFISIPIYKPVLNTWKDVAESESLRVAVPQGGVFANTLLNATSGVMKTLGDSLRRYPEDVVLKIPGELERILSSGCCAYAEAQHFAAVYTYRSAMQNKGQCKFTMGKPLDYTEAWCFPLAKDFPFFKELNMQIQRVIEAGLLIHMGNKYAKSIDKCLAREAVRPKNSKLDIYDLSGVFIMLALGLSISLLILLVELLFGSWCTTCHRSTRKPIIV